MSSTNYAEIWNRYEFEPTIPEEQPNMCLYAQQFSSWTEELLLGVVRNPTVVSVNQAMVLLLHKWMEWRNSVPKRHRSYIGNPNAINGHMCIWHIFETTYNRLRVVELSLTPPMLFLPQPPPPPPPPPQIAGIFLGDMEEE